MGNWVTTYKMVQRPSIKQLTLTYREVAHDFRKEVKRQTRARIPAGNRVAKGSFGPSFAATTGGKEAYQGDAFNSEIVPSRDEGEQNNGAKEQGGSGKSKRPKRRPNRASGIAEPEGKRPKRGPNSNQSLSLDQGPNSDLGTATSTCPCCGQFHRLARCFYVFPKLAPDGFEERDHLRIKVKKALQNPDVQKEVEKLRHQREAKQQAQQQSQN